MIRGTPGRVVFTALCLLSAVLALVAALGVGRYDMSARDALGRLLSADAREADSRETYIVRSVRLPRALLAAATGAALAGGGVTMQALFRNPLVSPFVVGLSPGASLGAAVAIVCAGGSAFAVESLAFLFGLAAVLGSWFLSGCGRDTTRLLLAGIVIGSAAQSAIGLLQYFADPEHQLPALTFWMLGGLDGATGPSVARALPVVGAGLLLLLTRTGTMNLLSLGDLEARSLGVETGRTRFLLLAVSTLVVTTCVARTGVIAWIGLAVPHLVRLVIGPDHRLLFPAAAGLGAAFLVVCDGVARTATTGEVPVGIVTAAAGAPLFALLLLTSGRTGWR